MIKLRVSKVESSSFKTGLSNFRTVAFIVFVISRRKKKEKAMILNHQHAMVYPVYTMPNLVAAMSRASTSAVNLAKAFLEPSGLYKREKIARLISMVVQERKPYAVFAKGAAGTYLTKVLTLTVSTS